MGCSRPFLCVKITFMFFPRVILKKGPPEGRLLNWATRLAGTAFRFGSAPLNAREIRYGACTATRPVDSPLRTEANEVALPERDHHGLVGARVVRRVVHLQARLGGHRQINAALIANVDVARIDQSHNAVRHVLGNNGGQTEQHAASHAQAGELRLTERVLHQGQRQSSGRLHDEHAGGRSVVRRDERTKQCANIAAHCIRIIAAGGGAIDAVHDRRRVLFRSSRLGRVDEVDVQALAQRGGQLVADDDVSGRAGITNHLHRGHRNVCYFQRLQRGAAEIKLGQRLGLTFANPVAIATRGLTYQRNAERNTAKAWDAALAKSAQDGLRTQVLDEIGKHAALVTYQRASPGAISVVAAGTAAFVTKRSVARTICSWSPYRLLAIWIASRCSRWPRARHLAARAKATPGSSF